MRKKVVEKALSLVGQGYIYGAKGQTCSQEFRAQQARQYPEQAKNILEAGEYARICDVARSVGFTDSLYFSRVYKEQFGTAPSAHGK